MEWKEVRLGDVCSKIGSGATPSGGKEAYKGGDYHLIRSQNVLDFAFSKDGLASINDEQANKLKNVEIIQGDVLLNITGDSVARCCIVPSEILPARVNQHVAIIRPRKEELDNHYLLYYLQYYKRQLLQIASAGATRNAITKAMIENLILPCPKSLDDQRRIASILSSLDRKIELNNKINADLEEMAQAIFKNWFVDFEPFKDGKFVDSELGMIPEGWKVGSYSEMIESLISGDWGKDNPQGNYTHEVACVRGCDFQDINNGVRGKTPQRYILEKNYQAKHLKDKDILVEISGGTATVSTGRTSLVTEELLKKYQYDIVCTNFCKVLRPLSQFSSYVYYSWKYKYDNDIMFGYENGTSGIKNFAIKDFIEKEPVLIPKEQDIVEFQKIIDNLQKQKQIKGTENTTLSLLRDTLLPHLMSGELEVPE